MDRIRMEFEMPSEILNYVSINDKDYNEKVKKLMIYVLVKEGKISFGKGAEILGINKIHFITDLGKMGIPYYYEEFKEVEDDLKNCKPSYEPNTNEKWIPCNSDTDRR